VTQVDDDKKDHFEMLVAFGANVAMDGKTLSQAVQSAILTLNGRTLQLLRHSRLFQTPCFPAGAGPDYVNAVAAYQTALGAKDVMALLHKVENDMGRERVQRWGSRTIDIDLLAFGDLVLPDAATFWQWHDLPPEQQAVTAPDRLILPHPRLSERAFVLIPLCDIAPEWRHPVLGQTARQMADALPEAEKAAVRPLQS
jgi:2-amino-4-hydroxy-6-hydroxymethyldihydropteridine diphosphokinase